MNLVSVTNQIFEDEKALQEKLQNYLTAWSEYVGGEKLSEAKKNLKEIKKAREIAVKIIEHGDLWTFDNGKKPRESKKNAMKDGEMDNYKKELQKMIDSIHKASYNEDTRFLKEVINSTKEYIKDTRPVVEALDDGRAAAEVLDLSLIHI